jgi:dolichol-phosphate mannosyltransferase
VLNERDNVRPLVQRLREALDGIDWDVIFVDDDSPDGTAAEVRMVSQEDSRVRVVQRIGRNGLSSACIEGMMASSAPFVAVIDGDMQHDERILPEMLRRARAGDLDVVVGSRNVQGGGMGEFAKERVRLSNMGKLLSEKLLNCPTSDPMSGFFLVARPFLEEVVRNLSQVGFKILVDFFSSANRPVRFEEVGYTFRNREHGESKLDFSVNLDFLLLLADKRLHGMVPPRFLLYSLVGLSGVVVHTLVLAAILWVMPGDFAWGQSIATLVAIVWNFFLNNSVTYRDRKLKTPGAMLMGFLIYFAGCLVGFVSNLAISEMLVDRGVPPLGAGIVGMLISAVWNFAVATSLAWQVGRRRRLRRNATRVAQTA